MDASKTCEACGHRLQQDDAARLPVWLRCANPECTPGESLIYSHVSQCGPERVRYVRHLARDAEAGDGVVGYVWAREGAQPDTQTAQLWIVEERAARHFRATIQP